MKREKKRQIILVFLLLCIMGAMACTFFWACFIVPANAQRSFGAASSRLDDAKRILYALRLEVHKHELLEALDPQGDERIFTVHSGQSASEVARNLEIEGLIGYPEVFRDYLVYRGYDRGIQAGVYALSSSMNALEIAEHLVDDDPSDVTFSFLAGWRAEEIAALLPYSGLAIPSEDFIRVVRKDCGAEGSPEAACDDSLEGFLYPDEYQVMRNATANDLVKHFSENFHDQIPSDYAERVKEKGLSLQEAVILASMVQKEAVIRDESGLIASVFLNRLREGMPLQSDPTVQYTAGYDAVSGSWWKNPLSQADLQIDSPYNTYLRAGLPPAAICNPGLDALLAIVEAPQTSYYYFRASCNDSGSHVFSETYEQHLEATCP